MLITIASVWLLCHLPSQNEFSVQCQSLSLAGKFSWYLTLLDLLHSAPVFPLFPAAAAAALLLLTYLESLWYCIKGSLPLLLLSLSMLQLALHSTNHPLPLISCTLIAILLFFCF